MSADGPGAGDAVPDGGAPPGPRTDPAPTGAPGGGARPLGLADGSVTKGRAALAGLAAVVAAIGSSELVAALLEPAQSLVVAVGDVVIDTVPGWLERAAIGLLGTADKPVLVAGVVVVSVLLGMALGVLGRRRFTLAAVGFVFFAAVGVAAAIADPRSSLVQSLLVGLVAAAVGILVLRRLLALARAGAVAGSSRASQEAATSTVHGRPDGVPSPGAEPMVVPEQPAGTDRRRFLAAAGVVTGLGALGGFGGWALAGRDRIDSIRAAIGLPVPARPAGPVPPGADLEIAGLTPLFVPNEDFYRIDTALRIPAIEPSTWRLEVRGMVDNPFTLTYDELMSMPHIEADITLSCVSNPVGGDLVGNARWQGVPLHTLLERAGVQEGATQLIGLSTDGFTAGFPTITALDVKESMVAVGMNGEPLPAVHGFPARLVVPGLYGYVSATKWLSAIVLTDWDEQGYWIPRGWAQEGPVKTQARIDVPRSGGRPVTAGSTVIAGVAWAPTRGIEAVEVKIDDGPWVQAELAESLDVDTWRQWFLPWEATPGEHVITARATDGLGETQTDERTPVAPDGASGHPVIRVVVRD